MAIYFNTKYRVIVCAGIIATLTNGFCNYDVTSKLKSFENFLMENRAQVQLCPDCISSTSQYKELKSMGPNILDDLLPIYLAEKDQMNTIIYRQLVCDISKFRFIYNDNASTQTVQKTSLTIEGSDEYFPLSDKNRMEQQKLGSLWALKKSSQFASEKSESFSSNKLMLSNESSFSQRRTSPFVQLQTSGIFNLPAVITAIKNENSSLAFLEFLRLSDDPLYACPTGEWLKCASHVSEKYPTTADKMKLVEAWWMKARDKFTNLTKLHLNISESIGSSIN